MVKKTVLSITAVLLLAACASQTPPPLTPTIAMVAATANEISGINLSPADYAAIGVTLARQSCANWFTQQVVQADQSRFGATALSTLGGMSAAAAGATPIGAGVAAGASGIAALLGASQAASPAGANPAAAFGLVSRVQQAWLAASPVPMTVPDAYALVEAYAEQCSLPVIQNDVMQALNSVSVSAAASSSVAPALPVAEAPATASNTLRTRTLKSTKSRSRTQETVPSPPPPWGWDQWGRPFTGRLPQVTIGH